MSLIFGLFNRDGSPVDPEDVQAMYQGMQHHPHEKYLHKNTQKYKEINCINLSSLNLEECISIIDKLIEIHKDSSSGSQGS